MARASRAPSVSVWTPRGEHRRKAFTLRHPHHRPSFYSCIRTVYCMLYRFSAGISYYCYLFTFLLVYIVLILDCVGYFHRPKKPLIQSRYTHISECFLLARLRRRINAYVCHTLMQKARHITFCFSRTLPGVTHIAASATKRMSATTLHAARFNSFYDRQWNQQ